jgi:peptidoglycan/xylan/chitin deacetylase (PgdA/CDA1 family)
VTVPDGLAARREALDPGGKATPEALALLLRREGATVEWGEPVEFRSIRELARFSRARGHSSIVVLRADPSLLANLQLGSWFDVRWRFRLLRRLAAAIAPAVVATSTVLPRTHLVAVAVDAAFWAGVRSAATRREWRRLTRSSYTALYYHRIAGELKPGQERMDISPAKFARQLRLLHRLRFTPLSADDVTAFHDAADVVLPRRCYALTVDDGFRDAVDVLVRHPEQRAQLFVCTSTVGGPADWAEGEPIAGWSELERLLESGTFVGSHASSHADLTRVEALEDALGGSRRELESRLGSSAELLAYPHGRRNEAVRRAAAAAGYRAAYTTDPGRNGAGTSPYDLRRVGPKEWDSSLSFLWKVVTGELVPAAWERRLLARARSRSRSQPSSAARDVAEGAARSSEATPQREQP